MRSSEQIKTELENCELMISVEHLKEYNLIKRYWLKWVLNEADRPKELDESLAPQVKSNE